MGGCHLHVGSFESAWEIDEIGIETVADLNPFPDWIGSHFPGETDPSIIGMHADPDDDGIDNASECIILGDPQSVSAAGYRAPITTATDLGLSLAILQGGVQTRNEDGSVTLFYPTLGASLTISGSRDLRTWSEWISGGLESAPPPGPEFPDLEGTPWSYRRWTLGTTSPQGFLRTDFRE